MVTGTEEGWQGCRKNRDSWEHEYKTYLRTVTFHPYGDTLVPNSPLTLVILIGSLRALWGGCRAESGNGLVSVQIRLVTLLSLHMLIFKKLETQKAPPKLAQLPLNLPFASYCFCSISVFWFFSFAIWLFVKWFLAILHRLECEFT